MFGPPTLLDFNRDGSGRLLEWLKKMGLENFLNNYSLSDLIEWGWIKPVYRAIFPSQFFESWEDYPYTPWTPPAELSLYSVMWDYAWEPDDPEVPYWFLDPAFRPNTEMAKLLKDPRDAPVPEAFIHSNGRQIFPSIDYFYPWQAFALIDVIRASDCLIPLYRTPDVIVRAQEVLRAAEYLNVHSSEGPTRVLADPNGWGGITELMTWLAHLRSFHDALFRSPSKHNLPELRARYRIGAKELAKFFDVTEQRLTDAIRNKLLVIAKSWMDAQDSGQSNGTWSRQGWKYLRREVQLAVEWLIILSGKPFSHFVDLWKKPYFGHLDWAPLEQALPYKFLEHERKFATTVSYYLKEFNDIRNNQWALNEASAVVACRSIRKKNYPFGGFLAAFFELHEHLGYDSFDKGGVDFRELRPLDQYAMLAIHAEGCLRRELDAAGRLSEISGKNQTLSRYIEELATLRGLPTRLIGQFSHHKKLADLKDDRTDPIGRIYTLTSDLPKKEHALLQAFLCCLLARNYFAHHDFLDNELLQTPMSAFLLKGIVLSVVTLLNSVDGSIVEARHRG